MTIEDAIPKAYKKPGYCPWPKKKRFLNALEACEALIRVINRAKAAGEDSYPTSFYECHDKHGNSGCGGWHFSSTEENLPQVLSVAREAKKRHLQ